MKGGWPSIALQSNTAWFTDIINRRVGNLRTAFSNAHDFLKRLILQHRDMSFFLNSSHDDAILIVWGSHLSSPRAGLLASGHAILGLLLARVAMATCLSESVSVCMSVCLPQVGVLPKRLNESGLLWYGSFLPPILHCVKRKFGYLQNEGTFPRTPDLDNFASVYRSSKRVTDLARRLG